MLLSNFGREYLLLGLRLNKLIDGYVDAYYGPLELKKIVDNENNKSPKSLLKSCRTLKKKLVYQGFTEDRVKFLEKMLDAMETSLEILNGKEMPFLEQVFRTYDIKPKLIEDSVFYKVKEDLDTLYEGSGDLVDRIKEAKQKQELPNDKIEGTFIRALEISREKTNEIFPDLLPKDEELTIKVVKNEPWSAYNWYLGNHKSRIDVNIDLPIEWTNFLKLATHEGYPGHHTEHAIKEKKLYQEENSFEHAILLIPTPEAVIAEGIGNTGIDVLFSTREKLSISLEKLCPNAQDEDLELFFFRDQAWNKLSGFSNNVAIHAHVDGWSDDQLIDYVSSFGFYTKKYIQQQLKFIRHPLWSTYVFTYFIGESLIKKKFGSRPSPKDFETLLTRPILPSDLY